MGEERIEQEGEAAAEAACLQECTGRDELADFDGGAETRFVGVGVPFQRLLMQRSHLSEHDDVVNREEQRDIHRETALFETRAGLAEAASDLQQVFGDVAFSQVQEVDEQEEPGWLGGEWQFEALMSTERDVDVRGIFDAAREEPEVVERPG